MRTFFIKNDAFDKVCHENVMTLQLVILVNEPYVYNSAPAYRVENNNIFIYLL